MPIMPMLAWLAALIVVGFVAAREERRERMERRGERQLPEATVIHIGAPRRRVLSAVRCVEQCAICQARDAGPCDAGLHS
jgi:hypothetical protein